MSQFKSIPSSYEHYPLFPCHFVSFPLVRWCCDQMLSGSGVCCHVKLSIQPWLTVEDPLVFNLFHQIPETQSVVFHAWSDFHSLHFAGVGIDPPWDDLLFGFSVSRRLVLRLCFHIVFLEPFRQVSYIEIWINDACR